VTEAMQNGGTDKGKSPGILEIPGLFLAEKERFELQGKCVIWILYIKIHANMSKNSVLIYQTVIIRDNTVVA
jgi:hypothetical protein